MHKVDKSITDIAFVFEVDSQIQKVKISKMRFVNNIKQHLLEIIKLENVSLLT